MPVFKITTNKIQLNTQLASRCSQFIADLLQKPEKYVLVELVYNPNMLMAGTDLPLAMIELKSIGFCSDISEISLKVCSFVSEITEINPERIYIEFTDINGAYWGWNNRTF